MQIQINGTLGNVPFLLVLSSDHITPGTGFSPTVTLSKNGGTFAAAAGAITEISQGWYKLAGNATDANTAGAFVLHGTATNCDPTDVMHEVVAFNPRDARLGVGAVAITEGYAALNAAPTEDQFKTQVFQRLVPTKRSVTGTIETVLKLDGTATGMTFSINDNSNPTAENRAS